MALNTNGICSDASAVTPSDTTQIQALALWVGGGGNLRVEMASGAVVTFTGVPAGALLPIEVRRVLSTSTTATNIVALR